MKKNKKQEAKDVVMKSLKSLNPEQFPAAPVKQKYLTTIVVETDYYPEELDDGIISFFINIHANPNTKVIKTEVKKQGKI
jgi:hypothetical protein